MFDLKFEPTISEIMGEPMVRALMKADRVDARQFEARLRRLAGDAKGEAAGDGEAAEDVSRRCFVPPAARAAMERCCWG